MVKAPAVQVPLILSYIHAHVRLVRRSLFRFKIISTFPSTEAYFVVCVCAEKLSLFVYVFASKDGNEAVKILTLLLLESRYSLFVHTVERFFFVFLPFFFFVPFLFFFLLFFAVFFLFCFVVSTGFKHEHHSDLIGKL